MIGVIVLSGPSPAMHGLDAQRTSSLLPLGDRPALQHIVESLVTQGITSIELIVGHAPELVEKLLGNGDRWGCRFRYHLAVQTDRPYRSLRVIPEIATEPWVLIHAEQYPCVDFCSTPVTKTILHYGAFQKPAELGMPQAPAHEEDREYSWGGTVVSPATVVTDAFANSTLDELRGHFEQMIAAGSAAITRDADWLDLSTPERLLQSQTKLLEKKLAGLLISGTERQAGIWVSRNVMIHPSAILVPPLYIGPNSRLNRGARIGPNTVIGADCIVDSNTTVENSLVVEGSYVGQALEVSKAIVSHNLLVNVRLDASVDISEDFLLGRLARPHRQPWTGQVIHSLLAALLTLVFLPLTILSTLYYFIFCHIRYTSLEIVRTPLEEKSFVMRSCSLPCLGLNAWGIRRSASWEVFLRQFLPGLFAVLRGNLYLVGLPPRTVEEIEALPKDWRALYVAVKSGLITEAGTASTDLEDNMQLYLADAYYSVRRTWSYDLVLAARYFSRLVMPRQNSGRRLSVKPSDFHNERESLETK